MLGGLPAALHIRMRIRVPQYACAVKVPFREIGSRNRSVPFRRIVRPYFGAEEGIRPRHS